MQIRKLHLYTSTKPHFAHITHERTLNMPQLIKTDAYCAGCTIPVSELHIAPPVARLIMLHKLHYVIVPRETAPIVAGDVITFVCHQPSDHHVQSLTAFSTLTLSIYVTGTKTIIAAKQLSAADEDYFAVSLGFDNVNVYRRFYLGRQERFGGKLIFFVLGEQHASSSADPA